eukprot:4379059-Lingulodinium_polyedra.AAC.1
MAQKRQEWVLPRQGREPAAKKNRLGLRGWRLRFRASHPDREHVHATPDVDAVRGSRALAVDIAVR